MKRKYITIPLPFIDLGSVSNLSKHFTDKKMETLFLNHFGMP